MIHDIRDELLGVKKFKYSVSPPSSLSSASNSDTEFSEQLLHPLLFQHHAPILPLPSPIPKQTSWSYMLPNQLEIVYINHPFHADAEHVTDNFRLPLSNNVYEIDDIDDSESNKNKIR
jgi:hypothetical protein